MSQKTVLLVEDNPKLMKANRGALSMRDFRVLEAATLQEARLALETETPDSFVLDIMLPDGDGRDFCMELRERYGMKAPILFLTALKEGPDMDRGYDAGATDYLTKPFDLNHLVRKVTAQIEQYEQARRDATEFSAGGLRLDYVSRRAYLDEKDLLLKAKEYALLELLIKNRGRYITAEELFERVWDMKPEQDLRTIKVHVSGLRRKLGDNAPVTIESERGKGYRIQT